MGETDPRLLKVGTALWSEDLGTLGAALREVGVWPEDAGRLLGDLGAEEVLGVVAAFVGLCRRTGWPESPTGALVWAVKAGGAEWSKSLASERRRRDARKRSPEERAALRAFMGDAGVVIGAASDAVVVPGGSGSGGPDPLAWDGRL